MTMLLALDPGGTTGYAVVQYDAITPMTLIEHGQIASGKDGFIEWALGRRGDFDEVVSESFVIDGRTAFPDVTPLRIETAVDMTFGRWGDGCPVAWQRNVMKAHADDILLKRVGLWLKGEQHARDAVRHSIAYLKTRRHAPTLAWLYGRKEAA